MISPFKCIWNNCESKLDTFCGVFFWEKLTDLFAEVKEKIIWLMMFNSGILRNGRLDDCWMQWKLPSRSSLSAPRCFKMSHWYPPTPQTQRDHPGCVRRWNVSEPSVFRSFFFGGWGLVSFFFSPCRKWSFLAWVILVMQWKQMDIASVASIAHTIWIRDPECFIFSFFCLFFGWFFMAFWCCCFSHVFAILQIWTYPLNLPEIFARYSGERLIACKCLLRRSFKHSGVRRWNMREKRFCISQQRAEQNRDVNCWYKISSRVYNRKVLMEKILWAPVHRVQIPMHELPRLLYSNHKCLTIGFNVQVMSALMPIVLLKVRKPPKKQTDYGCKSLIRQKNIVAGGRICFVHTFFKQILSLYIYIYIWKNLRVEMMEREDTPQSNSAISAGSQGTTSDSWGDLEPVRQLKKNICSIGVWAWLDIWNCRDHQSPMTPKGFLIFALSFLVFPTGNRFGWQLDCSGCLFIYVIMTLEGIPNFQIRTKPWLSCVSLL